MTEGTAVVAIIIGLLLRFGIPVGLTAALVWLLKRLDSRWQAEAESNTDLKRSPVVNPGCWKIRACPKSERARCKAYARPEEPCWQVFRVQDGRLADKCLLCQVFRQAPVPILTKIGEGMT